MFICPQYVPETDYSESDGESIEIPTAESGGRNEIPMNSTQIEEPTVQNMVRA